jgi:predicted nicotinamide N-methyase
VTDPSPGPGSSAAVERQLVSLRRRLERRRRLEDVRLEIPGATHPYVVAQPSNPDAVLDEITDPTAADLHMPYWATLWPSGLALAEHALTYKDLLAHKRVLELGCGLGTTATALMEVQTDLTVVDCFAEALAYARYNIMRNNNSEPRAVLADWRVSSGVARLISLGPFDAVFAADVLYEKEDVAPLLDLVPRLLTDDGAFWLAEPGRATSQRFVADADMCRWRRNTMELERIWPCGAGYANVRLHVFRTA